MNKKDLIPVIILVLLIPIWMLFFAPKFAQKTTVTTLEEPQTTEAPIDTAGDTELSSAAPEKIETEAPAPEPEEIAEEQIVSLRNDKLVLELTSLGGGIKSATLLDFPKLKAEDSGPVILDFTSAPAMTYSGLPGMKINSPVSIEAGSDGKSATLRRTLDGGVFERTISLGDNYTLNITDRFSAAGANWTLPAFRIMSGRMENPADMKATKGVSLLGVDSYSETAGIHYWGRNILKLFKNNGEPAVLEAVPDEMRNTPVDWVAAKNKFFTQIIGIEDSTATMALRCTRDPGEKKVVPHTIAAALDFQPASIAADRALELKYTYFIGPKKYKILKAEDNNFEGVMEFETIGKMSFMNWLMEPARKGLLLTLNFFYGIFNNYGVAIIVLTLLVRILFWPLTHKSTEKMRENSEKMQEVQPKLKVLQEKYKNNKTKLQEETMKVYQEHGFNPMGMMGGCLPMFVQLPVFIALYTVLRNAIELRYAGFLWIADLSAPENLFAGHIPIVGALNILPLVMSASMVWQQKLSSPTSMAATPEQQQQQKMMMVMMPVMMLFFFYSMPSGLVLYWTTSNLLMIAQTGFRNFWKKRKEA